MYAQDGCMQLRLLISALRDGPVQPDSGSGTISIYRTSITVRTLARVCR